MRGKPRLERDDSRTRRIIPAHAGQTWVWIRFFQTTTDHPRACGANEQDTDSDPDRIGSSPRMRGKHLFDAFRVRGGRIIPAHAGQTMRCARLGRVMKDHPRACGANASECSDPDCVGGSSPRMRGKPGRGRPIRARIRIIPAHAGQTSLLTVAVNPLPDHPRACGAN